MSGNRTFNFNAPGTVFNDIHDNNNCTIITGKAQDISDDIERESASKGAPYRYLFCVEGDDKIENVEVKKAQIANFQNYLKNFNLLNTDISASKENEILKAVVCFVHLWGKKKYTLSSPSVPAITRFLKQDCQLTFSVDEQTAINVLRSMMGKCDQTVLEQVEEYF